MFNLLFHETVFTPLHSGLSAVEILALRFFLDGRSFPNFLELNFPPSSDLTTTDSEGMPSTLRPAMDFSKACAASY